MAPQRKPRGHTRFFVFPGGVGCDMECAHVRLDGVFTKFLWANFYDREGREVSSYCKLLAAQSRWNSARPINTSGPLQQLLRDLMPHRGKWVRIQFANQIGGA